MSDAQTQSTVNINGKDYELSTLPTAAHSLLNVYNTWQADLKAAGDKFNELKLEIAKHEAALRDLAREIITTVEQHFSPAKEVAPVAVIASPDAGTATQ